MAAMRIPREQLERENAQVLNLVQAMIGGITHNMRGVSLVCSTEGLHLYFLLANDDENDREEIDDIVFELQALQQGLIDIDATVIVSADDSAFGLLQGRRIYGRKEPDHDS